MDDLETKIEEFFKANVEGVWSFEESVEINLDDFENCNCSK